MAPPVVVCTALDRPVGRFLPPHLARDPSACHARGLSPADASPPVPAAGSAAATTAALAASLVAMAARDSRDTWPEAAGVAAQAMSLEQRCSELADADAAVFGQALAALHGDAGGLAGRLIASVAVPLKIADAAADVTELAALTAGRSAGDFRDDAAAAAMLAEAATRAAAHLVRVNLGVGLDDERLAHAERACAVADAAARRALHAGT